MRPVNLIPPESRRGQGAPLRSGPLPYVALAVLVAVLLGVTALVLTGNEISDHKADLARVEAEDEVAAARAEKLSAFTQFRTMREQRITTVASLADSRFDWQRVMEELALILPSDVWLTELTASASAESGVEGGEGTLRGAIPGPALELKGCGVGHEAVAGFVTDLRDIDGVTRVGVQSSELPTPEATGAGAVGEGACEGRDDFATFGITVAFDAAPVPLSSAAPLPLPSASEQAQTTSSETSSKEGSEEGEESSEENAEGSPAEG
jgi:Tfp pilus assembly protein PilN